MKRRLRLGHPGLLLSAAVHGGLLLLLIAGAATVRPHPPEPVAVELVRSDELPEPERVNGTPLESTSNGSEVSSDAETGSADVATPKAPLNLPTLPRQQAAASPPDQAAAPPQAATSPPDTPAAPPQAAPPAALEGDTPPLPAEALVAPAPTPAQRPEESLQTADASASVRPDARDMFAMPLLLPGGRVSGGRDPPARTPAKLPHDDTAAFRVRLSTCAQLPAWVMQDEDAAIVVRILFNRDGTLAATPQLLRSSLSAAAVALTNTALTALQSCQPFTELPPDKYDTWKRLDLVVTPLALSGR